MAVAKKTQLEQLAAEFKPEEHKTRSQGGTKLTYLSIDATINRLNAVLGAGWSTEAKTSVTPLDGTFLAVCELTLKGTIDGTEKSAYGVGADKAGDVDKAAKTALAEALKKAGHQLGIGLYLWDADSRGAIEKKQKLAGASTATLKQEVFKIAKSRIAKDSPTAKDIAELFGVAPGDLADDAKLRGILEAEGLL